MNKQNILNEPQGSLKVGVFNLTDGRNVSQLNNIDRSKVRCVIAYIDEERNIAIGLCPVKIMLPFAFGCLAVNTEGIKSGREATKILLEESAKQGIRLPAAEFCVNYDKSGIGKGEAFLLSSYELKQFSFQKELVKSLFQLGFWSGDRTLWSSTIGINFNVWMQSFSIAAVTGWHIQYRTFGVMPAVEIPL